MSAISSWFNIPDAIIKLVGDPDLKRRMPTRFLLKGKAFNIELQYFLDVEDINNIDAENKAVKFAVTTDGFTLLVELTSGDFEILQDEFGDVDRLGVSVKDLLDADRESI